ncbi:AAA family ATPase [Massilia sp. GER05]|uniref:AAA family ATPase n=1 Tax=Massilia sp. GER05 TaxID=3394605 RepID=UPI003F87985A
MDLSTPQHLYAMVSAEVDAILRGLQYGSSDQNVSEAIGNARDVFNNLARELGTDIASLQKNAKWEVFEIAFYGETNAGKSTIIEMLRIMLEEEGRRSNKQQFKQLQAEFNLTEEGIAAMRDRVEQYKTQAAELEAKHDDILTAARQRSQQLRAQIEVLGQQVVQIKAAAPLWQRFIYLFKQLPAQKQARELEQALNDNEVQATRAAAPAKQAWAEAQQHAAAAENALAQSEGQLKQLERYADGEIIGDGRSDNTRITGRYEFTVAGQRFALLDVPGIEGSERQVNDEISHAIEAAHAVFYVTAIASAPQKGDDGRMGTLEKIKSHLGAQSEVWTIYNKRATNPAVLAKNILVSKDEEDSLAALDTTMQEALGEHYCGHLAISAHPAFLGVAECLVPGSTKAKSRAKFLDAFPLETLLDRSGASAFRTKVASELVSNSEAKIVRSNFNKARQVVVAVDDKLTELRKETFQPLAKRLHADALDAEKQVDLAMNALKSRAHSIGAEAVDRFVTVTRERIYEQIDKDIGNDDFKQALERCLRQGQENLAKEMPKLMQGALEKFQSQIADVIDRFKEHASELLEAYGSIDMGGLSERFELKIKIDNGINIPGLVGAVAGAAILLSNPAGWAIIALGAVTAIVGLAKAVWGAFSSSYRMSQQRKAANENLSRIEDALRESVRKGLVEGWPQLEPKVEALNAAVQVPAEQVRQIDTILGSAQKQLKTIIKTIEKTGAK